MRKLCYNINTMDGCKNARDEYADGTYKAINKEGHTMSAENAGRKPMGVLGVAIDCPDQDALADFYVQMLSWKKTFSGSDFAVVSSPEAPFLLVFQGVEHYQAPVWPWEKDKQAQMMHFDFFVEDLEESVKHAKGCGATVSPVQFFEHGSTVMLDPVGHPFCLSTVREDSLYAK